MNNLLNKVASSAAGAVLFFVACVMAAIGLSVILLLAVFALATAGLAVLASPFVGMAQHTNNQEQDAVASA